MLNTSFIESILVLGTWDTNHLIVPYNIVHIQHNTGMVNVMLLLLVMSSPQALTTISIEEVKCPPQQLYHVCSVYDHEEQLVSTHTYTHAHAHIHACAHKLHYTALHYTILHCTKLNTHTHYTHAHTHTHTHTTSPPGLLFIISHL